jgi:hypothetical protein
MSTSTRYVETDALAGLREELMHAASLQGCPRSTS